MKKGVKKIKIAILAPLFLRVPPKKQGGTEWICFHQANELTRRGYDVTLFAVKGSKTFGKLIPVFRQGISAYKVIPSQMEASRKLRLETTALAYTFCELLKHQYDVIFHHARGGEIIIPFAKYIKTPIITILHLPLFPELASLYATYHTPLISISYHQRKKFPRLNYIGNAYNGVDTHLFGFCQSPKDYFLSITTIGEHKNPLAAILACKKAKQKLILAGKIRDQEYFQKKIKPHIDGKKIQYRGEIGLKEKIQLYQNAKGFLFPTIWDEPFGLVMIESLSCGTPVIGFRNAAVPEVIIHKKTGFIVPKNNIKLLAAALKNIGEINRQDCRMHAENNFSIEKMADAYESIIKKILSY